MKIEEFYKLSSKLSPFTVQAHATGLSGKEDGSGLFDQHRLIQGVYEGISFPVEFKQEYGKKLQDVLDTGWPGLFLISNKLRTVLEENDLTGWKTFAVKVIDDKGLEIQGYYGLSITGRCGKIDYHKSKIIEKRLAPEAPIGRYYKGLHIGLDEWDNSDFFLPEKYFGTIITNRVAEVLRKNNVTNIRLENLGDIETSDFALQKK